MSGGQVVLSAPARAALHTAYIGLITREKECSISSYFGVLDRVADPAVSLMTLGHTEPEDIPLILNDLPRTGGLKVKLGSPNDEATLRVVMDLGYRRLFLDTNQGWSQVDQALRIIDLVGAENVLGIEQPFPKDRWDLHEQLKDRTDVPVFADESVQGMADLERAPTAFDGVNLKLMKCGGLDRALEMSVRAREVGLQVMLGSMSESSLGCGTMAALAGIAHILDLDGPWLIANDPFVGMRVQHGRIFVEGTLGSGIELRLPDELDFRPIGV